MCGHYLETTDSACPSELTPPDLNLCEGCHAEFEDFKKILRGKKDHDVFWHNKEWIKLWSAWLDYNKAIKEFKKSNEFKRLIKPSLIED